MDITAPNIDARSTSTTQHKLVTNVPSTMALNAATFRSR